MWFHLLDNLIKVLFSPEIVTKYYFKAEIWVTQNEYSSFFSRLLGGVGGGGGQKTQN